MKKMTTTSSFEKCKNMYFVQSGVMVLLIHPNNMHENI